MNYTASAVRGTRLQDPAELLLVDTAIRIQLSVTNHNKAVKRLETQAEHLERPGSPLRGKIARIYAQGSMAIGATISHGSDKEEYDIDAMVEIDFPPDIDPEEALDILYKSVAGTAEEPTLYAPMTKRHTRCVQICYSDNMHVDLTPTVLLPNRNERTGLIFHSKPEDPDEPKEALYANPYGLAENFLTKTPSDVDFSSLFEARSIAFDSAYRVEKAEVEDVPEHEPFYNKSRALISLQLIKRWRNEVYRNLKDMRMPPSVLLAYWVAENANQTNPPSLLDELLHQVGSMLRIIDTADARHELVHQANPTCEDDLLTDRWPKEEFPQRLFKSELKKFQAALLSLKHDDLQIHEMQEIMENLFGQRPVRAAVDAFFKNQGSQHRSGSGSILPNSKIALTGIGLSKPSNASPIPKHNFFGSD